MNCWATCRYDTGARTYMPTMKIAALGSWVQGAIFGDGTLMKAMHQLSARFGETITLAVQSVTCMHSIYLIQSRLPHLVPAAHRHAAALTVGGLLMLAASAIPRSANSGNASASTGSTPRAPRS